MYAKVLKMLAQTARTLQWPSVKWQDYCYQWIFSINSADAEPLTIMFRSSLDLKR